LTDRKVTRRSEAMQLRHVSAVVAVADTGSLRAAANRLGVSQPAVTKAIREIETIMGVELLQKTVRGSVPTDAGRIFLVRARSIVEEMRRAKEEMSHVAGVRDGSVTVGLSVGAALLSGGAIETFMRSHPQVRVCVIEGLFDQLVSGVRQGRLDFSVGGLPTTEIEDRLRVETLFQNRIVPAVRHNHPLAGARSFAELAGCDWAITNDDPAYVSNIVRHFATLGLPAPRIRLRCESYFTLLQLVPRTDLVVAISHTLLRHPITAEHLRAIDIKDPCPTTRFALVRKSDVPLTPHANALAHFIAKAAADIRRQDFNSDAQEVPRRDLRKALHKDLRGRERTLATGRTHVHARGSR
jgi:LysR family transcriptional regulator, regulator of abg operon